MKPIRTLPLQRNVTSAFAAIIREGSNEGPERTVSQAYFALHKTLHDVQNF
jgi:hypothetical protein